MADHNQAYDKQINSSRHHEKSTKSTSSSKHASINSSKDSSKREQKPPSTSKRSILASPSHEKQSTSTERVKSWLAASDTYAFGARANNNIHARTRSTVHGLHRATEESARSRGG